MGRKRKQRKKFFKRLQKLMKQHSCSVFTSDHRIDFCFHEEGTEDKVVINVGESLFYDSILADFSH